MRRKAKRTSEPRVIVLHCVDSRFQEAFDTLIKEELGLRYGDFHRVVIAGGASVLAGLTEFGEDFDCVMGQIEFLLDHSPSVEKIILINHENCGRVTANEEQSKENLQTAAANVMSLIAKPSALEVALYYVGFSAIEKIQISERQLV